MLTLTCLEGEVLTVSIQWPLSIKTSLHSARNRLQQISIEMFDEKMQFKTSPDPWRRECPTHNAPKSHLVFISFLLFRIAFA